MKSKQYGLFAIISVIAILLNLITTFINVPLLISYLGVSNYGYWVLYTSLGLLVTIIGIGMPQATLKFMSAKADNGISSTFAPIVIVTVVQMVILSLLLIVLHRPILSLLHIPISSTNNLVLSFMGVTWVLGILLNVMYSVLYALSKHVIAYSLQCLSSAAMLVLNWTVLTLGYGLLGLGAVQAIITLGPLIFTIMYLKTQLKTFVHENRHKRIDPGTTWSIISYGFYQFTGQVAFGLIFNLDNIIANRFSGLNEMVYYSFRLKIFQILTSLVLKPFWNYIPMISSLFAESNMQGIKKILLRSLRISISLVCVVAIYYVFEIERIMGIWTGIAVPVNLKLDICFGLLLIVEQFGGNMAVVVAGMDLKTNRYFTVLSVFEALMNVTLTFVLGERFGLPGIICGTLIPRVTLTVLLLAKYMSKKLGVRLRELLSFVLHPTWCGFLLIAAFEASKTWIGHSTTFSFLSVSSMTGAVALTMMLLLSVDQSTRLNFLRTLRSKKIWVRNKGNPAS